MTLKKTERKSFLTCKFSLKKNMKIRKEKIFTDIEKGKFKENFS